MEDLLRAALDVADGVDYADARGVELTTETLAVKGQIVESFDRTESSGFGVRVLHKGAWGYAASATLSRAEAIRVAQTAVEVARASATAIARPVELVSEPVHHDSWNSPL